jgi:D-aminoacyl-tRNA deacylase
MNGWGSFMREKRFYECQGNDFLLCVWCEIFDTFSRSRRLADIFEGLKTCNAVRKIAFWQGIKQVIGMRLVIQRVSQAQVDIAGETVGKIGRGLMVLLGIAHDDGQLDIDWLVKKLIQLRIFTDGEGKMNLSVQDVGGDILVVSQFTLYADAKKGNRPSYIRSAPPTVSIPLYELFLATLRSQFAGAIATGEFGAMMDVALINEGPVTIVLDSRQQDF